MSRALTLVVMWVGAAAVAVGIGVAALALARGDATDRVLGAADIRAQLEAEISSSPTALPTEQPTPTTTPAHRASRSVQTQQPRHSPPPTTDSTVAGAAAVSRLVVTFGGTVAVRCTVAAGSHLVSLSPAPGYRVRSVSNDVVHGQGTARVVFESETHVDLQVTVTCQHGHPVSRVRVDPYDRDRNVPHAPHSAPSAPPRRS